MEKDAAYHIASEDGVSSAENICSIGRDALEEEGAAASPLSDLPLSDEEAADFFASCEETFRFFSQIFFKEMKREAIEDLANAVFPKENGNDKLDLGYLYIRRYFNFAAGDMRTQLSCEYARIFLAAGVYTKETRNAIPYESVFTSEEHLMMQDSRDDVVKRFKEDGFCVDASLHEPEDHIAFEFEYLGHMSARAAGLLKEKDYEGLLSTMVRQAEFIDGHLLNWIGQLNAVAHDHAKTTFYTGMLYVAEGFLEQTRLMLDDLYDHYLPMDGIS